MLENKIENICKVAWNYRKDTKRNIENTFENLISDEKQNNCANVGKKSKISAKSHEKVVKTSKKHWRQVWKATFAT